MFPNVYFICMKYRLQVCKQTCYLFQYSLKVVTGTTDAKIKIGLTENDDKKILLVIADVNLWQKTFKNSSITIRTISRNQVNQIIPLQMHQWKISHQT